MPVFRPLPFVTAGLIALAGIASLVPLRAQDRLRAMPGYERAQRMAPQLAGAWTSGAITPAWTGDSTSFTYMSGGRRFRFDVATMKPVNITGEQPGGSTGRARGQGPARGGGPFVEGSGGVSPAPTIDTDLGSGEARLAPTAQRGGMEQAQTEMPTTPVMGCPSSLAARGRQLDCIVSPDGRLKAFYRSRNLWIANRDGSGERQITRDGDERARVKYGSASWVYGEELGQTEAMWWAPNSGRLAFYRFDESQVRDFYVQMNQTDVQDTVDVEAYPKAGAPNPKADILIYDVNSASTMTIDARDGRPFDDGVGHYVYNVSWTSDSSEVLFNRANRRQQVLELAAYTVNAVKSRTLVHEEWLTGWVNTDADPRVSPSPTPRFLADGKRFIWESERNGWKNYYLYDLYKGLVAPLTSNTFEAVNLIKIDEAAGVLFYTARDGDNYLKIQLHRVGLDGKGDVRLTNPAFTHNIGSCLEASSPCAISPDNKHIVDVFQRHDEPPASQLIDAQAGRVVASIATGDTSRLRALGWRPSELVSYLSADGKTPLFAQISFPSDFDPSKKYPVLVPVYGGPVLPNNIPSESFAGPSTTAEYGFLIVTTGYRGVPGTGKRAADALYMKLGQTEMDDMADGIKAIWDRPYVHKGRIGIYGTSYGGYTAAMQLVRHPDIFAAASSSSPVTDWRHYDTIYTERYMWTPQGNKAGYDAGSVMTYASQLKGRLLLYYGTADNNVHQNNSMQLIAALQQAGKSFEVQVGPDQPHSAVPQARMLEFFIENLVMRPERLLGP